MDTSPRPLSLPASQNTPYTAQPLLSLYHHALEYVRLNWFFFRMAGRIRVSLAASARSPGSLGSTVGSG